MSDDETPPDNLVALPEKPRELRRKDDLPFQLVVNNTGAHCSHVSRHVDARRRTVSCGECGAPLDTFGVLLDVAQDHDRFAQSLRRARIDSRAAEDRIELLKRLESNARARAKRLGIRGSRDHYDSLIAYARAHTKLRRRDGSVDLDPPAPSVDEMERYLENRNPIELLKGALIAAERESFGAALELGRRALDELEAALDVAINEKRRQA